MRALPTPEECVRRLAMVFPRAAFDPALSSPIAGWAACALIYVDAIVPSNDEPAPDTTWARPATVLWLSDDVYARSDAASRSEWTAAQARSKRAAAKLVEEWGLAFTPRYGDNSREPLRDETFPRWLDEGALRTKAGVKTNSPLPRWALTEPFADLFDPACTGDALAERMESYRENQMSPDGRVKALVARERGDQAHAVRVTLPSGVVRMLEPGEASAILKGVIESWAPARLIDPVVLTISEPGDKVYTDDSAIIQRLGLAIDPTTLLPDALLVDIGLSPADFWVIEAVATDGPIDEDRKRALLRWAVTQRIPDGACNFLTAFGSRNAGPAKKRLKDLASGTFAWYLDEPGRELAWYELR